MDAIGNIGMDSIDENPFRNSIEIKRMDTSDEILLYERELRGWRKNLETSNWERPKKSNKYGITDDCVDFIIGEIKNFFTMTNLQANLSSKEGRRHFHETVMSLCNAFDWKLVVSEKEFNLSYEDRNMISHDFEEKMRLFLTRTLEDGERRRDNAGETFHHKDDMNSDDKGTFR